MVNTKLQEYWDKKRDSKIRFLDCSEFFVDKAHHAFVIRDLMPDFLHLNEKGHKKWAECLDPVLSEWIPRTSSGSDQAGLDHHTSRLDGRKQGGPTKRKRMPVRGTLARSECS